MMIMLAIHLLSLCVWGTSVCVFVRNVSQNSKMSRIAALFFFRKHQRKNPLTVVVIVLVVSYLNGVLCVSYSIVTCAWLFIIF